MNKVIVKRKLYKNIPEWIEEFACTAFNKFKVVAYESKDDLYMFTNYKNCIYDNSQFSKEIIIFEGESSHRELKVGETITINNEDFKIKSVKYDVTGAYIYNIDDLYEKDDLYDDYLKICEVKYLNYIKSKELNIYNEELKNVKKSKWKWLS